MPDLNSALTPQFVSGRVEGRAFEAKPTSSQNYPIPWIIAQFRADLAAADVGDPTIRKLMSIVQGVIQRAVEWQRLATNPVRAVRKPPQRTDAPHRAAFAVDC